MKSPSLSLIISLSITLCLTLWLLESPLKYGLFLFEVALILILYYSPSLKSTIIMSKIVDNITSKADYFFSITSLILLIPILLHWNNTISFICAIFFSFCLPGYGLLRLLGFTYHSTWFEWPVLAFAISVGVTPL